MGFNIADFFNEETKKDMKADWKPVRISVHKLRPAAGKENFYHMHDEEVIETARTIELIGVQQYPVVKPIEGTDEYEVIAGHKRRLAVLLLLSEGKTEYEMIPCKVENTADGIRNRLILIFTNSTQRERTDYEKMQEIKEVRELLEEWKKNNDMPGKMQNVIAEILGTNKTKIGTLENIKKNLIPAFKEEFAEGNISTSAANEIAGLGAEAQQELYKTFKETGSLTMKEVKTLKEVDQIPRQKNIYEYPECLPDSMKTEPKTPEPSEKKNTKPDVIEKSFMNEPKEPETIVTYNQPAPDNTDRKSLVVNGKINLNKEYGGMKIDYFMGAIIGSDLCDDNFWEGWKNITGKKWEYIADYAGTKITYTVRTTETERCEGVLTNDGMEVCRIAAHQRGFISYKELAELIDIMIYTKIIQIKTVEENLKSWSRKTVKELLLFTDYLTESEAYILQDLLLHCKERAGK